jgi:2-polyprenyl-3-methyl-5-hydroxy-6-metoxy-1,4-benzoquinol methylase
MHDSESYKGRRKDLMALLHDPALLLDVGCNEGNVAREAKRLFPGVKVWGLEINPKALEKAMPILDGGWALNLDLTDELRMALRDLEFDHILAGDVLEHTVHFQEITGILYERLKPGGRMIVSVPNYGHWHTLWVFFTRKWQRNERGIFDKTHRTIIMRGNLPEFLERCPNGTLKLAKRNFRLFETNRLWKVNMALTYMLFPLMFIPYVRDFFTMAYVFTISKPGR